jgi:hypothetical protein
MFFSAASAIAATPLQKNKEIVLYRTFVATSRKSSYFKKKKLK